MNKYAIPFTVILLLFMSGCTVKGDYTCGVPNNGVRCQPMNETHQQLYDGSLNSFHVEPFPDDSNADNSNADSVDDSDPYFLNSTNSKQAAKHSIHPALGNIKSIEPKQAILSKPRELRIWFDRFTDAEGDLHDESFMFIRLDNGHWTIDNKPVLY
jgi:conjugal transfer pilus assembly protein TraV